MPASPGVEPLHHEPILYSGDPIEGGGHDGGAAPRPAATARLRGLPVLFLSRGAQVYAGGAPFTERTTVGELINREEVRAVERRAVQDRQAPPDAFVFFSEAGTEVKVLLWSDRGFTVLHQLLEEGTFAAPRKFAPGEKIPVEELGRMFCGPARLNAPVPAARAEPAPPGLH